MAAKKRLRIASLDCAAAFGLALEDAMAEASNVFEVYARVCSKHFK